MSKIDKNNEINRLGVVKAVKEANLSATKEGKVWKLVTSMPEAEEVWSKIKAIEDNHKNFRDIHFSCFNKYENAQY